MYEVTIEVQLKPGISDPQGATVERAIPALGYTGISNVRIGKCIRMRVDAPNEESARKQTQELCDHFLTNPVIERAVITVEPELVNA